MDVKTQRRIDIWLGVPLCAVLTFWRWITSPFRRPPAGDVRRVLFVKLAEQGSTVLAYGAIRRVADDVGRENVYFLVFDENRFILDAMEVIPRENVIEIGVSGILSTLFSTVAAVWKVRSLGFDAAIDLEFYARSTAALTYLSKAKRRVGLHAFAGDGPWRGDLMTHRMAYNPHYHTAQLFDLEARALRRDPDTFPTYGARAVPVEELPRGRFTPRDDEIASVSATLAEVTGRADRPRLVLLNANCSDLVPLRRWEDERYIALARRLLEEDEDLTVALTGGPSEQEPVAALAERIGSPRCVSMAGRTSLRELLVLYGLAEVLVTNDSGPAHFASLTTIDVVTLFGPETPKLFGVVGERSHLLWAQTACSPCVSAYNNRVSLCRDNVCMQQISVDEVHAMVREILDTRRAGAPTPAGCESGAMEP